MIVRNERAIIERCLTSALPLLDAAVVCDTGSTDETPQIVGDFFARESIPFTIRHHAWTGFGANRTMAIQEAGRFVSDLGWPLDRTYWLFLDADHELVVESTFDRNRLNTDAIALRQRSRSLSYWNLRFARASLDWRAVGRTHERYISPAQPAFERRPHPWIRDRADGNSRGGKHQRDIAWLSEQLVETPGDPRSLFYLAQSYLAGGDAMKALLLYRRRIEVGDESEEAWYSKYSVGRILARAGHLDAGVRALLEAHAADPARAEPHYELSCLYLRHQRRDEAIASAERGLALPMPSDRNLFVHADVYEHKLALQLAEAAVGTANSRRGRDACERVALSRSSPDAAIEEAQRLAVRYASQPSGLTFMPLRPAALPQPYRPCNPAIVRTGDGYLAVARGVNYEQRRLRYRPLEEDGVFRTRNVLMRLNTSFDALHESEIEIDDAPLRQGKVQGLEDCRLVATPGGVLFTCVTADRHPSGFVHQSVCRLDACGRVIAHRPLLGRFDDRHQKNWLPFIGANGELLAIYGYDPLTVVRVSVESGAYAVELQVRAPVNATRWRGSAGPIPWPDDRSGRHLVLVHEAVRREGHDSVAERVYLHRFVEYDADFTLLRLSHPFVFAHKGVEFVCGMTAAHGDADLIIGLGIEDREAYLARIPFARINDLLYNPYPLITDP